MTDIKITRRAVILSGAVLALPLPTWPRDRIFEAGDDVPEWVMKCTPRNNKGRFRYCRFGCKVHAREVSSSKFPVEVAQLDDGVMLDFSGDWYLLEGRPTLWKLIPKVFPWREYLAPYSPSYVGSCLFPLPEGDAIEIHAGAYEGCALQWVGTPCVT